MTEAEDRRHGGASAEVSRRNAALLQDARRNLLELGASLERNLAHLPQYATAVLALCDMRVIYLGNVPDDVAERLERMAARAGMSLSAFAARELAAVARRADSEALLNALPTLDVDIASIVEAVDDSRARR